MVDYWGVVIPQLSILKDCPLVQLHGKMKQRKSISILHCSSKWYSNVTDVGARGLDASGVDWVVQYDEPKDPKDFVHGVGRTARMGRPGMSLIFLYLKGVSLCRISKE